MTITNIDELMMMGDHLIEYESLSPQDLADLVLANEDMFIATSALAELSIRNHPLAGEVAYQVFKDDLGDQWIKASAFDNLYRWNKPEAIKIFDATVEEAPLVVLDAMITCIDREEAKRYKNDAFLNSLVYRLIKRIQTIGQENLKDPEFANFLLGYFPELQERANQEIKFNTKSNDAKNSSH